MLTKTEVVRLGVIGCWILLSSVALGQSVKHRALEQLFQRFHEQESFQGVVLVADQGEVVYRAAYGLADHSANVSNTLDTRFHIASISKQFTAALVLQLVEDGLVHPDSSLLTYYPAYRADVGARVSIHHLLTHQSGIPNYTSLPYVWSDSIKSAYPAEVLVKKFGSGDLEFEPGSRFQYSNTGYLLLSIVAERVTGLPFDVLMRRSILTPAGLRHSGVNQSASGVKGLALGYEKTSQGFMPSEEMHMANLQGAGNMYATVEDLYRWDQALYEHQILSEKMTQAMMRPYVSADNQWIPPYRNSYGYGVGLASISLTDENTVPMIFHSGHVHGFSSFYARFPEDQQVVIMLSNTGNLSTVRMNQLAQEVLKVLHNQPYTLPERDWAEEVYQTVRREGTAAAIRHFQRLKDDFPYQFQNSSSLLQALGERLVEEGDDQAIDIFWFNSQLHPHWSTFYRLAVAHQAADQTEAAVRYYRQALSLNPQRTPEDKEGFHRTQEVLVDLEALVPQTAEER